MDHPCIPGHGSPRSGLSTLGEALIVIAALLGFAVPFALGYQLTIEDAWTYAGFLLIVVVFYFLLLLCRAVYVFMIHGNGMCREQCEASKKHGR